MKTITKITSKTIEYYDLFPLLRELEAERPGIKERIWNFLCDEWDVAFKPYNGRLININLFYYGVGNEYSISGVTDDEIYDCKNNIHAEAFISGSKEEQLRLDLNLIWKVYEPKDPECFSVITQW